MEAWSRIALPCHNDEASSVEESNRCHTFNQYIPRWRVDVVRKGKLELAVGEGKGPSREKPAQYPDSPTAVQKKKKKVDVCPGGPCFSTKCPKGSAH